MPDQKVMSQIDNHNVTNTVSNTEMYKEIDNRTSYDRMKSPTLGDGDAFSVLPLIKSRMDMVDENGEENHDI